MRSERYVLSKSKEIFDETLQDIKICPVGKIATSESLYTVIARANSMPCESVISEKRQASSLLGQRKNK